MKKTKTIEATTLELALRKVLTEMKRARKKHPEWRSDLMWQIGVMGEEMGEVSKAGVQFIGEGGEFGAIEEEVVQLAGVCLRFLEEMESVRPQPGRLMFRDFSITGLMEKLTAIPETKTRIHTKRR